MAWLALAIAAAWFVATRGDGRASEYAQFLTIVGLPAAGMLLLAWLSGGGLPRRRRSWRALI